ncbi:MAG: GTPase Era [Desulfovibrionaceae bacterium]|nr:GTPase Era [Desulfovibrionaceae bacterium]
MKKAHRFGRVAIMGPPNAGKSTLTNALVGQKVAIVTAKPQTTRNRVTGILTEPDAQVVFMDTPGVQALRTHLRGQMGKMMSQSAWQTFSDADLIMLVADADLYLRHEDFLEKDLSPLLKALAEEERPVIVAVNKVDLFHDKSRMLPLLTLLSSRLPKAEIFPLSALRRDGVAELRRLIIEKLPEGEALYPEDQVSTLPMRFMASEIIREQLFERLRQEVPYSIAVEIENWEEDEGRDQVIINAAIYVSRPSHKAMVIGKGGSGIKAIGTEARRQIAEMIGRKVHLELWVKVREDWSEDERLLNELGFGAESGEWL